MTSAEENWNCSWSLSHSEPTETPISFLLLMLVMVAILSISEKLSAGESIQTSKILTGKVRAGDVQNFTVPWSPNWNHQIKWMKQEGEIVAEGELVVLFDTANLDSLIEQQEANLRQTHEKAKESRLNLEQKVIEAEHALVKAELEYKLAKLESEIPTKFRSDFEKDNIEFDLKKATTRLHQSKEKLTIAKATLTADNKKQAIEIERLSAVLTKQQKELERLQLRAERRGTVLHAMHPWNGTKISEGQSVQTTWNVASIPGIGDESIEAWVNEVDWHAVRLGQVVSLVLDAYPDKPFKGRITKIGQQAENKFEWGTATYYTIQIEITENPASPLFPGMSVRIELPITSQLNTLQTGVIKDTGHTIDSLIELSKTRQTESINLPSSVQTKGSEGRL